jgi:hypothetical protein
VSGLVLLFATALGTSSFLLFLVEPIVARMVLPGLGGGPMVWNTSMLFFQGMLLGGYAYAHVASQWLRARSRTAFYVVLLLAPFVFLPFAVPVGVGPPPDVRRPVGWLLTALFGSIGAPFFVLASSTPALQRLFADTDDPAGSDPYFLYIAGNAGSLLALLSYPALVEPLLTLHDQSRLWSFGYGAFVALALLCVVIAARTPRKLPLPPDREAAAGEPVAVSRNRKVRWVAFAAIPSSLMLGVTGYLTSDIAPVPLLWIAPLALYLLTFVLAFSRPHYWRQAADRRLPLFVVVVSVSLLIHAGGPLWFVVPLHLVTFFVAGLLCHGSLAEDRPAPSQLTEFYVWIAVGGVIGGLFNTLVAPLVFKGIAEYPIALVLASFCRQGRPSERPGHPSLADVLVPAGVALLVLGFIAGLHPLGAQRFAFFVPALLCFSQSRHVTRFANCLGALFLTGALAPYANEFGQVLFTERTFFGIYRVSMTASGTYYSLFHGATLHGLAAIDPGRAAEPLSYYHRAGPFGQAWDRLPHASMTPEVAVVGLGVGSLASYAAPGQHWTIYEIDPAVARIARDARYFHYLDACGDRCEVVTGDARLSMTSRGATRYGFIVLDAFSSDAIPVHLVTREAIALYLSRLTPEGVLMFHISNRHLRLGPVLARAAGSFGLTVLEQQDLNPSPDLVRDGLGPSDWVVMARRPEELGTLRTDRRWFTPPVSASTPLWTDDFSNILSVLNLRQ